MQAVVSSYEGLVVQRVFLGLIESSVRCVRCVPA